MTPWLPRRKLRALGLPTPISYDDSVSARESDGASQRLDEIAERVEGWSREGTTAVVARVVEYRGFGGSRRGELLAVNAAGERAGQLLRGGLDEDVLAAANSLFTSGPGARTLEVPVHSEDAVSIGLSCGGRATVIVSSVEGLPEELWPALGRRAAVAVCVREGAPYAALVVDESGSICGSLGDRALDEDVASHAGSLLERRVPVAEKLGEDVLLQTFHPTRRLVVVGDGELAGALSGQAALLGWESRIADDRRSAEDGLAHLGRSDGLILLSHDPALDAPILAKALESRVGYVGALGSRNTQRRRAAALLELGVSDERIGSIHGPVGLDIRASSPAETALAICAEILAVAAGRAPVSLRDSSLPIHAEAPVSARV